MRINLYFNDNDPKDKLIIDFLNQKYSAQGCIKETLYNMAIGAPVSTTQESIKSIIIESKVEDMDEYEAIDNIDEIEL